MLIEILREIKIQQIWVFSAGENFETKWSSILANKESLEKFSEFTIFLQDFYRWKMMIEGGK